MAKIFWVTLLVFFSLAAGAQHRSRIISPDSLLKMFQVDSPFYVLRKLNLAYVTDFKGIYDHAQLKPYLLEWLSKESYRRYEISRDLKRFSENRENIEDEIEYKLKKQKQGAWLDSILRDPDVYAKYKDSVVADQLVLYQTNRKVETSYPPDDAVWFHSFIAYPESYKIIRQFWEERGKQVWNNGYFDTYFMALVRMGDPEARRIFDKEIAQLVKTNGKSGRLVEFYNALVANRNSYGIRKMIEVLSVDQKYEVIAGDPPVAFNCRIVKVLVSQLVENRISADPKIKNNDPCEAQLRYKKRIIEASQKLADKYEENEKYWMENMPFNK